MNTIDQLIHFWKKRIDFEPLIAKRQAWDLESFARDRRQLGLICKIKDQDIISKLQKINKNCSTIDCYNPFPQEHFHITVKILGTISSEKENPNDYSLPEIDDLLLNLKSKLSWFKQFSISIRNINLFPSVVFAEVQDNDKFKELNQLICDVNEVITFPERDIENYIPHIALGNFISNNVKDLVLKLTELRTTDFGYTTIDSIDMVKVDLTAPVPEFETLDRIELRK